MDKGPGAPIFSTVTKTSSAIVPIRSTEFADHFVYGYLPKSETTRPDGNRAITLLLHGFPAESGKNEDIAREIATSLGEPAFLTHYRGLGDAPGSFSFLDAIEESTTLARALLEKYPAHRLDLVGHSFGGLVALNVIAALIEAEPTDPSRVGRVFLMAPLTFLPAPEQAEALSIGYLERQRKRRELVDTAKLRADFETVRARHAPLDLIPRLAAVLPRIKIVQGSQDFIVPAMMNRAFVDRCPSPRPVYQEIPDTHWFGDRPRIRALCREWLAGT